MAQAEDMLHEILGDSERLNQALELARLLKGTGSPASAEASPADEPIPAFDPAELLSSLGSRGSAESHAHHDYNHDHHHDPHPPHGGQSSGMSPSALAEILPPLLLAFTGDSGALCPEKVTLVKAIKPYAAGHKDSIDRAIKMAGIAKAAKSAISTMSKKG